MRYALKKGRRKNALTFNPNSKFIADAVVDFLKKGGKIKKVEVNEGDYSKFIQMRSFEEDTFLECDTRKLIKIRQ